MSESEGPTRISSKDPEKQTINNKGSVTVADAEKPKGGLQKYSYSCEILDFILFEF